MTTEKADFSPDEAVVDMTVNIGVDDVGMDSRRAKKKIDFSKIKHKHWCGVRRQCVLIAAPMLVFVIIMRAKVKPNQTALSRPKYPKN